ncbi:hypothetical protein J5X84_40235 [Streptosporangiaceae bacterium NEAU-GS5]|nr:hypothetical protein [Streptosporangiaceae bacterium NEAU-GS5]
MTTFAFVRRAALALCVVPLAACGSGGATAAPEVTVTVTATPSAGGASAAAVSSPEASSAATPRPSAAASQPVLDSPDDDDWPVISGAKPEIFGAQFQADPGHDFTKGISPSRDGVIRAELRTMQDQNVVEYVPVKWAKDHWVAPPEGDAMAYAAAISSSVDFRSAIGCGSKEDQTINGEYLGTERCSRDKLISRAVKGRLYALVTITSGRVQKVVEIYTA